MVSEAVSIPIERFDEVTSTNIIARQWIAQGQGPRAFVSRRQSSGVGRFGRAWHSPEGGLWCTSVWPIDPAEMSDVLNGLGLRIGVACWKTVSAFVDDPSSVKLKWPNDVLIHRQKACGCLVESVRTDTGLWLIVGVGINVTNDPAALPNELRTPATSIHRYRTKQVEPEDLLPTLLREIRRHLRWSPGLLDNLQHVLAGIGTRVIAEIPTKATSSGSPGVVRREATLLGVDELGQLICRFETESDAGTVVSLPPGSTIELVEWLLESKNVQSPRSADR